MKRFFALLLIVTVYLLSACAGTVTTNSSIEVGGRSVSVDGGTYMDISAVELHAMLQNKDFVFVNVHIPFEGDIDQTDISIPYDQIDQNLNQIPEDKDAKIVLYCRSGHMSGIAAENLVGLGYTNIWNLSGGMVAWERAGFEIDR